METDDVIAQLDGLIEQATTERSHFYVKMVAENAKREILKLRYLKAMEDYMFNKMTEVD